MPGVKGKSGRKSKFEEDMLMEVCNLSVNTIRQFLLDITIPVKLRVQIAKDFALRKVPTKLEGEGFSTQNIINIIRPEQNKEENANKVRHLQ